MTRAALVAMLGVLAAGCGGGGTGGGGDGALSSRLVDTTLDPPLVNALDVDPGSGDFLLTTNKGFYRIDPGSKQVEEVTGTVTADGNSSTVGTFLEITAVGPGTLLGSGHPDEEGELPSYLGFIRSDDAGRTWQILSRLGEADLHKIVVKDDRLYAFDAVLGAMLISDDGGRTFAERPTPRGGLVNDFVVDPEDPAFLLAATDDQLFRSEDDGERWREVPAEPSTRLTWPEPGMLLAAAKDGTISRSTDRGATFSPVGKVDGEPYRFKSLDAQRHFLALSDGTITESRDGGRTWSVAFAP